MAVTASRISPGAVLDAGYPDLMPVANEMCSLALSGLAKARKRFSDSDVFWTNHRTSSLDKVAAMMAEDLFTA